MNFEISAANSVRALLLLSLLATALPVTVFAKPNGYPGEHSALKPLDPAVVAKRKADRAKRIELRKKRREEQRLKRSNNKNNRSN